MANIFNNPWEGNPWEGNPWENQYNFGANAPSIGVNPMPGPQSPPGQSFGEFQKPFETPSPWGTVPQVQQQQAQTLGMQAPQVQQLGGPMNPVQTLGQGGVPQQTQGYRIPLLGTVSQPPRFGQQFPSRRFGPQPPRFGPQPPRFGPQPPRFAPQPPRRVPQQPPGRIAGSSVADRGRQIQRGLANQLQGYNRQTTSSTSPSPRVGMLGGKTKRSFGF